MNATWLHNQSIYLWETSVTNWSSLGKWVNYHGLVTGGWEEASCIYKEGKGRPHGPLSHSPLFLQCFFTSTFLLFSYFCISLSSSEFPNMISVYNSVVFDNHWSCIAEEEWGDGSQDVEYKAGDWLLFGSEVDGLPPAALEQCSTGQYAGGTIRLPMSETYVRSLNLSVSAGIGVYEALRQLDAQNNYSSLDVNQGTDQAMMMSAADCSYNDGFPWLYWQDSVWKQEVQKELPLNGCAVRNNVRKWDSQWAFVECRRSCGLAGWNGETYSENSSSKVLSYFHGHSYSLYNHIFHTSFHLLAVRLSAESISVLFHPQAQTHQTPVSQAMFQKPHHSFCKSMHNWLAPWTFPWECLQILKQEDDDFVICDV